MFLNTNCAKVNRSIFNLKEEILSTIREEDCDIVILGETDLPNLDVAKDFRVDGFETFIPGSENKKIRIILLVKKTIKFNEINSSGTSPLVAIEVQRTNLKNIAIVGFYREWLKSQEEQQSQIKDLNNLLSKLKNRSVCIAGDLDLNLERFDDPTCNYFKLAQNLQQVCQENGLNIKSLEETFFYKTETNIKGSSLDYFLVTEDISKEKIFSKGSMSDHLSIHINIPFECKKAEEICSIHCRTKVKDKFKFRKDLLRALEPRLLGLISMGCEEQANELTSSFRRVLDIHAPLKTQKIKDSKRPILSPGTLSEIKERNQLQNRLKKKSMTSSEKTILFKKVKRAKNRVTNLIKKDKISKVIQDIESGSNIWKVINNVLEKKEKRSKIELIEEGQKLNSDQEVADTLNEYFLEKIRMLKQSIKPELMHDPVKKLRNKMKGKNIKFSFSQVSVKEVERIISKMKTSKSCGLDGISVFHLKMVRKEMSPFLSQMINSSLSQGIFPSAFKTAKITPLYKIKEKITDKKNYRPISGLSTFGKVLETIADLQMRRFCEKHGLFGIHQHGFRKSRSTSSALLSTYVKLRENRLKKKWQGILAFDLSAAYDTISPNILIEKAKICGFDSVALNWLTSFVTDRKQAVMIGDYIAQPVNLTCGIPQGSPCSCLLFIFYVGDYCDWIEANAQAFADDTLLFKEKDDPKELLKYLEEQAKKTFEYFASNSLVANESKTVFMLVRPKGEKCTSTFKIKLGEEYIEESRSEKLLGIMLQNDLKWNDHMEKVSKKVNYGLYQLKRLVNDGFIFYLLSKTGL